jgi:hypothetical protein
MEVGKRQRHQGRDTKDWQLSCLPNWPHHCRATPTECLPFLGNVVSSTIDATMAPSRSIFGSTIWRTLASTALSDQGALATKCSSDWCFAAVRAGAVNAAIGSTLLRSPDNSKPAQSSCSGVTRSA